MNLLLGERVDVFDFFLIREDAGRQAGDDFGDFEKAEDHKDEDEKAEDEAEANEETKEPEEESNVQV